MTPCIRQSLVSPPLVATSSSLVMFVAPLGKVTKSYQRTDGPNTGLDAMFARSSATRLLYIYSDVDFVTRARLVKHLLERRVRSKARGESCQKAFLQTNPARTPSDIQHQLEARDAVQAKIDRKAGHTGIIAGRPCKRTQASILSKRAQTQRDASLKGPPPQKRRRLIQKTPPPLADVQHMQVATT